MSTPSSEQDPIADAWRDLQATITASRAALDRVRSQPVHTREEREELHRDALSGALGNDMRRLAEHVEAGETSWSEAFEGESPYSPLLREHVARMADEHEEQVRQAVAEDDDFDPWAPSPEVDSQT